MDEISLNLVVLRSPDIERAAACYTCLGLRFVRHRHGNGPEHFAAEIAGAVFELYPLADDAASTLGARVGFRVPSLDAALAAVAHYSEALVMPPKDSPWVGGRSSRTRTVIESS
jgi:hypothetical protein